MTREFSISGKGPEVPNCTPPWKHVKHVVCFNLVPSLSAIMPSESILQQMLNMLVTSVFCLWRSGNLIRTCLDCRGLRGLRGLCLILILLLLVGLERRINVGMCAVQVRSELCHLAKPSVPEPYCPLSLQVPALQPSPGNTWKAMTADRWMSHQRLQMSTLPPAQGKLGRGRR